MDDFIAFKNHNGNHNKKEATAMATAVGAAATIFGLGTFYLVHRAGKAIRNIWGH